ncbi:MAG: hypothetical protein HQL27_03195 [Candidatus Omnitrophica bacterium]|nr:hypothetical protein [Candidatus Omnitrophota bacterium]
MTKANWLKVLNPFLFASVLIQAVTISFMILEQGNNLIYKTHKYNGISIVLLAAIHLMLNWNWVKATFFKSQPAAK